MRRVAERPEKPRTEICRLPQGVARGRDFYEPVRLAKG